MAKIPLREYNREIEKLIEHGDIDQAIGHCKTILKVYPKHLDTYRSLARAYLEAQRYSEASDILQRVLSVVPDDFVSHIGMSIVREDEHDLDGALWHMERAYEVQPSNKAIQEELRRLYGQRDGIAPPKIRLTRGALIRLYLRGGLHRQAIAEACAALAEDPNRPDLQVVLARLYDLETMKVESAEQASALIKNLPFCMEANRLLAKALPGTSRASDAEVYLQRLYAVEPYARYINDLAAPFTDAPDQSVMAEKLDWTPGSTVEDVPAWTQNIGVEFEKQDEELPDWLAAVTANEDLSASSPSSRDQELLSGLAAPAAESEEVIPDWMSDAGWGVSDRPADEIAAQEAATSAEIIANSDSLAEPAELPDWIQSLAPEANTITDEDTMSWLTGAASTTPSSTQADDAFLASLVNGEAADTSDSNLPDWLAGLEEEFAGETPPAITSEPDKSTASTPAWFDSVENEAVENSKDELPEWLAGLDAPSAVAPSDEPLAETDDLSSWLSSLEPETEKQPTQPEETLKPTEVSNWQPPVIEEPTPTEAAAPEIEDETPEWLTALSDDDAEPVYVSDSAVPDWLTTLDEAPVADETVTSSDEEALPTWLASISDTPETEASQPVDTASLAEPASSIPEWLSALEQNDADEATPANAEEAAPDWLTSLENAPTEIPEISNEIEPQSVTAESPSVAASSESIDLANLSDDDAFAWLESLAAAQGADEATLVTKPEERLETPPEWVLQLQEPTLADETPANSNEAPPSFIEPNGETQISEEPPVTAEPWVSMAAELPELETPVEIEPESAPIDDLQTSISRSEWTEPLEQEPQVEGSIEANTTTFSEDAAFAWLESLAAAQGADEETLITHTEERSETPPDWIKDLQQASVVDAVEPDRAPTPAEDSLPAWLFMEEEVQTETPVAPVPETEAPVKQELEWEETPVEILEHDTQPVRVVASQTPVEVEPSPQSALIEEPEPAEAEVETEDLDSIPVFSVQAQEIVPEPVTEFSEPLNEGSDSFEDRIGRGENLDQVIKELHDALYRYPVDIGLWQTLGDAYMRSGKLQDALDAYTKAEELLR